MFMASMENNTIRCIATTYAYLALIPRGNNTLFPCSIQLVQLYAMHLPQESGDYPLLTNLSNPEYS